MSRDLAIDLGTANTLVYARGQGIILNEPTVIALNSRTQDVLAMGHEAWHMIGRTPGHIVAVRPGRPEPHLIEQPMAAATGASLPIHEPLGNMVIDIGGGTSEMAVISMGGIVALEAVRIGGFDIDAAISNHLRRAH